MKEDSIQENGIIYLSAGFDGPFVLQAFSVRKLPPPNVGLQMCLTDGKVYIGAKYTNADYPQVQDYWLVQITAKFISQSQPIIIKTIQVINTYPRKLLGSPPCTLLDHFNKQIGRTGEDKMGDPAKKIKYSGGFDLPLLKNSDIKKPAQKQKAPAQYVSIPTNIYKRKQDIKPKIETEKKTNEKKLKIADSEQQMGEQQNFVAKKQNGNGNSAKKEEEIKISQNQGQQLLKTCSIQDLYEKKADWSILCRVNYLNKVECNTGLIANNFMLTDKNGDQIKCVYFQNPMDGEDDKLEAGKYYVFADGEINFPKSLNKSEGQKQIHITFDKNATIIPKQNVQFPLNLNKFCRINNINSKEPNSQINVIGIIKEMRFLQQSTKNKCKFSSTICDPLTNYEIDLLLFLNHQQKPPQRGAIGFLHNFQLFKQHNVCRLNSTYKSYFREQKAFKDDLTGQLRRIKQQKDWQNLYYKNLSSVAFVFRTIRDLKKIVNNTDDDKVYSFIDCWILDINKKKFYHACKTCKKGTDKKDSGVYYCPHCKRNVQTFHCHTLTVNFADFTSNLSVDVIGQHAETLLQIKSSQFSQLSPDRQLTHLNQLKFKNVTIKLKTQRKEIQRKETHSVWAIQNSNAANTLKQIKRKMEEGKFRMEQKW